MNASFLHVLVALAAFGGSIWLLYRVVDDAQAKLKTLWSLIGEARKQSGPIRWPGLGKAAPYLTALVLLLVAFSASAAPANPGMFDQMGMDYKNAAAGWFGPLFGYANTLFGLLAAIEVTWAAAMWAFEKDNLSSFTAALIRKIMTLGVYYAILLNAGTWIPAIVDSFVQAGQTAGGTGSLSPSDVVTAGLDCAFRILESITNLGLVEAIVVGIIAGVCALLIMLCFVIIAGQLLIALIESYIVIGAGVLFLGFGGSRWTTDFVQKVLGYAVSVGVKLLILYLVIGVGMTSANSWSNLLAAGVAGNDDFLRNCFFVLAGSLLFVFISWSIPSLAGSMLGGAPSLTAGAAAGVMGGVAAGGVALAAGAAGGVGNLLKKAASLGGSGSGPSGGAGKQLAGAAAGGGSVGGLGASGSAPGGSASLKAATSAPAVPPPSLPSTPSSSAPSSSGPGDTPVSVAPPATTPSSDSTSSAAADSANGSGQQGSDKAAGSATSSASASTAAPLPATTTNGSGTTLAGGSTDKPVTATGTGSSATTSAVGNTQASATPSPASPSAPTTSTASPTNSAQQGATTQPGSASLEQEMATPGVSDTLGQEMLTPGNAENSIGGAGGETTNQPPQDKERKPGLIERLKNVKPPHLPNDQGGGGTVHIKLDHGRD